MPFKQGIAKSGGRKPGIPNRRTLEFREILEELNFCPVRAMVELHEKTKDNPDTQHVAAKCASEIAQYVYPKRKAIEHSGLNGEKMGFEIVIKEYKTTPPVKPE